MNDFDTSGSDVARAAWLYYHEELTQGDIARLLGVSRSTVTRLLRRAKDEGLVKVTLNVTSGMFRAERDLERAYGLDSVRIVPVADDGAIQKRWLGRAAAELLAALVVEDAVLAVSWGSTMQAMADALVGQNTVPGVQVVAMVGGLHNAELGTNTNEIATQVGQRFGATVRPLLAPVYVQDEATAAGLANDPGIRESLELARNASTVVYSMGAMHDEATLFKIGHITPEQRRFLADRRAVGDIVCRWIDRDGQPVELPPSINPISISLEDFRAIPRRMAVAGGELKRDALLASLRGGFVTALVSDENTAAFLLDRR
ncbi:sugar-binding transcriptional regulator [Lichenibacterium dinghuense]|uniref:sugar-binding transcriptional regulator n=1 Tax=Lichenibacterium dinghuense TaxID=2895977 RepID=UPI001F2DA7B9|nr:sugar-binding transcriptional regulator [Lichenibacterium sp. 6Y81]